MSTVLFDVGGPRARRRQRILSTVCFAALVCAVAFIGYRFSVTGQFSSIRWQWLEYVQVQKDLVTALLNTLKAFASAAVLALILGALLAAGRLSVHGFARRISTTFVEFFRAIPLVILMSVFYYGLPILDVPMTPYAAVVIGLVVYNGPVIAEVLRAGITAVPGGQREAGLALGLTETQIMRTILLPQAISSMLPALVSQLVVLLKDTAVGFLITYPELLFYARYLGSQGTFDRPIVPTTIVMAAVYVTMCLALTALATYLERRNRRRPVQRRPSQTRLAGPPVIVPHRYDGRPVAVDHDRG